MHLAARYQSFRKGLRSLRMTHGTRDAAIAPEGSMRLPRGLEIFLYLCLFCFLFGQRL